jgi:hypothetical protein
MQSNPPAEISDLYIKKKTGQKRKTVRQFRQFPLTRSQNKVNEWETKRG